MFLQVLNYTWSTLFGSGFYINESGNLVTFRDVFLFFLIADILFNIIVMVLHSDSVDVG